mmetsp:Transcript_46468/g.145676  ORF Transcript_46468/g.145676 Transcript_46468/m.145676 type:complete len:501 (-) Transcript_46468:60-1562(-)
MYLPGPGSSATRSGRCTSAWDALLDPRPRQPCSLQPQARRLPETVNTSECQAPAATARNGAPRVLPLTTAGSAASLRAFPRPSCPQELLPNAMTVPHSVNSSECESPHATAVTRTAVSGPRGGQAGAHGRGSWSLVRCPACMDQPRRAPSLEIARNCLGPAAAATRPAPDRSWPLGRTVDSPASSAKSPPPQLTALRSIKKLLWLPQQRDAQVQSMAACRGVNTLCVSLPAKHWPRELSPHANTTPRGASDPMPLGLSECTKFEPGSIRDATESPQEISISVWETRACHSNIFCMTVSATLSALCSDGLGSSASITRLSSSQSSPRTGALTPVPASSPSSRAAPVGTDATAVTQGAGLHSSCQSPAPVAARSPVRWASGAGFASPSPLQGSARRAAVSVAWGGTTSPTATVPSRIVCSRGEEGLLPLAVGETAALLLVAGRPSPTPMAGAPSGVSVLRLRRGTREARQSASTPRCVQRSATHVEGSTSSWTGLFSGASRT